MRRILLTLTLLLLTGTAQAAEPAANTNPVFGTGTCGKPFDCRSLAGDASSAIAQARLCADDLFGLSADGFGVGARFDSANCITSKPGPKPAAGLTMSVKCCVAPAAVNGTCVLRCTRYGLR